MSDIKLNTATHDIELTAGSMTLVTGDEAIAQNIRIRLKFFFQEWAFDQRLGIPYHRDILIKNPDLDLLRYLFRKTVLTTAGVKSVDSLTVTLNKSTRTLALTFRATLDSGTELVFEPFELDI